MKPFLIVLPADVYRGQCSGTRGKCDGDPNLTALMVINAKFGGDKVALWRMIAAMSIQVLKHTDVARYHYISPVNGRDSKFDLAYALAEGIARNTGIPFKTLLTHHNTRALSLARGKNVLLIDDVIYKGRTMRKSTTALQTAGAKSVDFLAFGKSHHAP